MLVNPSIPHQPKGSKKGPGAGAWKRLELLGESSLGLVLGGPPHPGERLGPGTPGWLGIVGEGPQKLGGGAAGDAAVGRRVLEIQVPPDAGGRARRGTRALLGACLILLAATKKSASWTSGRQPQCPYQTREDRKVEVTITARNTLLPILARLCGLWHFRAFIEPA